MNAVVALDQLLAGRRVWRGRPATQAPADAHPTGLAALDAVLPGGGWPAAALSEVLLPADGVGELELVWPALAALSREGTRGESKRSESAGSGSTIALIAPPYLPYAPAWQAAGVCLPALQVVEAATRDALWAAEQCLRSGACAAVLCWPQQADDRALRRLQVAAETGRALGFVFRPLRAAANPSPAALRIAIDSAPRRLRVLKCRGAAIPPSPIPFPQARAAELHAHDARAADPQRSAAHAQDASA